MITTNNIKPQKQPQKQEVPKSPQRQPRPDLDTVRVMAGGMATIEVSIDANRILVGGQPFVQKGAIQCGDQDYDQLMRTLLQREGEMFELVGNEQENIVKCFGRWTNEAGEARLLLEYIPGDTLEERLYDNPDQKLGIKEISQVISGVSNALRYLHELEIVHRDVKPANIMIRKEDGNVILLDLGAAALFDSTGNKGEFFGAPTYASPEQLNELELDGRSDIFSLGIVFVEMVTGRHPFFVEGKLEETLDNIRNGRILPEVINEIPQEYQHIVDRMLAVDPAARYSNCEEISFDLNLMSLSFSEVSDQSAIRAEDAVFPLAPPLLH